MVSKTSHPLVSIIVPVYNGEKYIEKCIQSVLNQTFRNFELIIIDDGSTDNSLSIIQSLQKEDNRIIVIMQNNMGVSVARNNGMDHVNGKYVSFIDCDDCYKECMLERLFNLITYNNKVDLVLCGFSSIYFDHIEASTDIVDGMFSSAEIIDSIVAGGMMGSVWRAFFKTEVLKNINFRVLKYAEDMIFLFEYLLKCKNVYCTSESLYLYNKCNHESVSLNIYSEKYLDGFIKLPCLIYDIFDEHEKLNRNNLNKVAKEYALSAIRVKKTLSYNRFKTIMNKKEYRKYLSLVMGMGAKPIYSIIYYCLYFRFYMPFMFVKQKENRI